MRINDAWPVMALQKTKHGKGLYSQRVLCTLCHFKLLHEYKEPQRYQQISGSIKFGFSCWS
jgi:hypothetical protein